MEKILKGNKIAKKIKKELKQKIAKLKIKPGLAIILVGQNKASNVYVKIKEKACKEIGIYFELFTFKKEKTILVLEKKIITLIKNLNKRLDIHGILVQLPLPAELNTNKIIKTINPKKDVDGFHPQNIKNKIIISPVFKAIIEFLKIIPTSNLKQKKVLIIAKNKIFTEPLKFLLKKLKLNIAIYFYSKNYKIQELKKISQQADILIIAIGKPKFITADMVKKDAVVIDIGYNLIKNKSVGDVDFENVFKKIRFITPVPGGIGPLTVAFLLENCYEIAIK
ncbi:bifunctional methylenetetrahydrofolate dehydrogenase/methenyltetrahydrofolate cyclohydrolase [Candidatus Kuenenbacteria bacterium HGW-Kuenenbacteria-1]|uniref:Bifunctional protein FolD n=1 Tax=Candidatus Kuenenbacteria bacterium HGW-Kuenenbacteria-1 TaxID=2013812 RepID=A0A2N1UMU0_9BACT|nr:MAG: bifunctional methylenetetrahydrofolate dehydrogenase/methenyltetrahydrofolate cyclohydrolase [Candidatus Kuenenbacteria bacterium HGW-Kuenenbacteria-1]